jgi:pimeloyl-ACP methyl ester carboxylesterase
MAHSSQAEVRHLLLPEGTSLAYRALSGLPPTVVWLGGFSSDMTGTKATALEARCRARGRSYVRFDYRGHGASSGQFEDGSIGSWASDAGAVLEHVVEGPAVLVGSSMGGWLMLLAALSCPERIRGLVGIAAAPDFTEDLLRPRLDPRQEEELRSTGVTTLPNPYGKQPHRLSERFLEEAREHLVLRGRIGLTCPVRLLHGLRDEDVPWQTSLRLAQALESPDVTLTLLKGADHRCSDERSLGVLFRLLDELWETAAAG